MIKWDLQAICNVQTNVSQIKFTEAQTFITV